MGGFHRIDPVPIVVLDEQSSVAFQAQSTAAVDQETLYEGGEVLRRLGVWCFTI